MCLLCQLYLTQLTCQSWLFGLKSLLGLVIYLLPNMYCISLKIHCLNKLCPACKFICVYTVYYCGVRWLSCRTPASQSREPAFKSHLLPFPCMGIFVLSIGLYRENAIAVRVIDRSAYDATSRVHAHRQRKNLSYLRNGCCIYYLRPPGSAHL